MVALFYYMAYTFATKTPPVEPGQEDNFGGLVVDANHMAMTGATGAGPQTADATGTPNTSPLTVANNAITTLLIPLNAVRVNFVAATNTVNVSEADPTVATKYFTIPTGVQIAVDVARCSTLYLEANTGSSTLSFWFDVI